MNKVIKGINISEEYLKYIDNYINESFKMFDEYKYIEEFICEDNQVIQELRKHFIIEEAYENQSGVLIPLRFFHHGSTGKYNGRKIYMLDDKVFESNGYKVSYP